MNSGQRKPALVVMAAGMGSRFGGLKQVTPVGPAGETILDYSVYDALRAGFGAVAFVIKKAIEREFRAAVGDRIARHTEVRYVFQELDRLPAGFAPPPDRVKPWGTGHAVLCCRGVVDGPFVAINADDFYGSGCYRQMADFLGRPQAAGRPAGDQLAIALAGFRLDNTLTDNGAVSRGVCEVGPDGTLRGLTERVRIERRGGAPAFTEDDGTSWTPLAPDARVSMNCWGFPAGVLEPFDELFRGFLTANAARPGAEFYLPAAVDGLVQAGRATVTVLDSRDKWYGVTYREDADAVRAAIAAMVARGEYPRGVLA